MASRGIRGNHQWLLYGANGYTGRMIAREAVRRGETPILAGRSPEISALARELGLLDRRFSCVDSGEIRHHLNGVDLVLHCAGPFSATAQPMMEACLSAGAHYLDITGEIPVFERAQKWGSRFQASGIVAMPGVGFDVVPSDCLAARLSEEMPRASRLDLALSIGAGTSPGTTKTLIEGLHAGAVIRKGGKLVRVPAASEVRAVRFWPGQELKASAIFPWGDVSTAFYTTGIPEIRFFVATTPGLMRLLRTARLARPIFALRMVQNALQAAADRWVSGPDEQARESAPYFLWGKVWGTEGAEPRTRELRMRTPNGYTLTVDSALQAVTRVRRGAVPSGAWTPAKAFGWRFALELEGVEFSD